MTERNVFDEIENLLPQAEKVGKTIFATTPQGMALKKATFIGKIIVFVLWLLFIVFLGLTIWRTTLQPPQNTDTTSIALYITTSVLFIAAVAASIGLTYGMNRAKEHIERPGKLIRESLQLAKSL